MMTQKLETILEPVRKELKVNLSAEAAFRLFTSGVLDEIGIVHG